MLDEIVTYTEALVISKYSCSLVHTGHTFVASVD